MEKQNPTHRIFNALSTLLSAFIIFTISGCENTTDIVTPKFQSDSLFLKAKLLPGSTLKKFEGLYQINESSTPFGQNIVLKYNAGKICLYCERNGVYFILEGGIRNDSIGFSGLWRNPLSVGTGTARLLVLGNKSILDKIKNGESIDPTDIQFQIITQGSLEGDRNQTLNLRYIRSLTRTDETFWIIAHRGGGRNSDFLPYSENSIPLLRYAQYIGANGVEIDIKTTSDGVPILFHDSEFNPRLIPNGTLIGEVEKFSFEQIRTFTRLKNGENIPTLREALDFILDSTAITLIWLDLKSTNAMKQIVPIQVEYIKKANEVGRKLYIVLGLADEDFIREFKTLQNYISVPSVVETSAEDCRSVNAKAFAPRWTLGTQNTIMSQVKSEGRLAIVWTLDNQQYIKKFLDEGVFDGILTNYPSIVAYEHYSKQ